MKKLSILLILFTLFSCSKTPLKMANPSQIKFTANEYSNENTTFVSLINENSSLKVTYSINDNEIIYFYILNNKQCNITKRIMNNNNVSINTIDYNMYGKFNTIGNILNGRINGTSGNFIEFINYQL